jgi:hypothetical protein
MKPLGLISLVSTVLAVAGSAFGGDVRGSGMVVLDPVGSGALTMVGNSRVEIPARIVFVNSSHSRAINTSGSATLDAPLVNVVGGVRFSGGSGCTGTLREGMPPCANPFQSLSFPSTAGAADQGSVSMSSGHDRTLSPGFYSGISVSGNSRLDLEPGMYFIGEDGFRVTSGSVYGEGVVIVMMSGALDLSGTSALELSPPESGDLAGIVIAQPASNTEEMRIAGGREVLISGTLYAPGATLRLAGHSTISGEGPQMGDLVVAHRVALAGTASIKIGRPDAKPIDLPSLPVYD